MNKRISERVRELERYRERACVMGSVAAEGGGDRVGGDRRWLRKSAK